MTLGCGAIAGNITSDNIGPQHLYNIKRIAYLVRKPEEAFEAPAAAAPSGKSGSVDRGTVVAAVERYLASRGVTTTPSAAPSPTAAPSPVRTDVISSVVDRFLAAKKTQAPAPPAPAVAPPPAPPKAVESAPAIVSFVCENDVREAMRESRKIYVGPKTIITPSARDLGDQFGILVLAQR